MWPDELDHCTPDLPRREFPALVQEKHKQIILPAQLTKCWKTRISKTSKVSTFVFVEYCEGRWGGVGVPQSHRPIRRAGEKALVCAAVHQTPNRVRVSAQGSSQHRWICERNNKEELHSDIVIWLEPSNYNKTHEAVTVWVVGVDVGIGGVPALNSPVDTAAETLLPCTAHRHTQYSTPVV